MNLSLYYIDGERAERLHRDLNKALTHDLGPSEKRFAESVKSYIEEHGIATARQVEKLCYVLKAVHPEADVYEIPHRYFAATSPEEE